MGYMVEISKSYVEEDFDYGEIGEEVDMGKIDTRFILHFEDIIGLITQWYGHEPYLVNDCLVVTRHENSNDIEPTANEVALWKAKKCPLYETSYSFRIYEIKKLDKKDLKEKFKDLQEN